MIGVFDSGVGGLSVLRHIRNALPEADVLYVADQVRAPYGVRPASEIREIATEISVDLMERGARTVVLACHTASAAALLDLRATLPDVQFVGMEPAVRPAALTTDSGVIGVLATSVTLEGRLFEAVVRRYAGDMKVLTEACPRWVELVEAGDIHSRAAQHAVEEKVAPLLVAGADTLVLGCTHFPFLEPLIARVAGPHVRIIDPGPAVARQTARVHVGRGAGRLTLASTGDPRRLEDAAAVLCGIDPVEPALAFPVHVYA